MGVPESPAAVVASSRPLSAGSSDIAAAERAAEFLQQRLSVSAGMLKALQAQIDEDARGFSTTSGRADRRPSRHWTASTRGSPSRRIAPRTSPTWSRVRK